MRSLHAVAFVCGFWTAIVAGATPTPDAIRLPPELRRHASPSGERVVEIRAVDRWASNRARAAALGVGRSDQRPLWEVDLPHRYGPWLVLVTDAGVVVLFDEWLRAPGALAAMVIGPNGTERFRRSLGDFAGATGLPAATLVEQATVGPWMSAAPALSDQQHRVRIEAAGIVLEMRLDDGRIERLGPRRR